MSKSKTVIIDPLRKELTTKEIEKMVENAGLGLDYSFDDSRLKNIFFEDAHKKLFDNPAHEILDVMSMPEYFYLTCKWLMNVELIPFQQVVLQELWNRKYPMLIGTRGFSKSYLLAIYAWLRALFNQGCKIILVGAAFRQSKLIFDYMENIWKNAPILRNLVGSGRQQGPKRDIDKCTFYIGESIVHAIPIGDGGKIRGMRANYTIADEFSAISPEVFEVVIKGFGSVNASPAQKVKDTARMQVLQSLGYNTEADDILENMGFGNQLVVSGTAYYSFNHFYEYFKRYKAIIESRGDPRKLEEVFRGAVPESFNWKDFSIIRVPWFKLPSGFMNESQIGQAKATSHNTQYYMEYGAIFPNDSDGFFRRSLVESCVTKTPILLPSGPVKFSASLYGAPGHHYVYGIDPASENDNFSIIVLEVWPDHKRIVYCWTINRQVLRQRVKGNANASQEKSFYNYCARKIRELLKVFPSSHIAMDSQGGGIAIMEALHEMSELEPGELQIWPYVKQRMNDPFWWEVEEKPTDGYPGSHILHMVNFANADFTRDSNHGLRKDFESKTTLFPFFDTATIEESIAMDKITGRDYDTLEDCVMELEQLKDELATILHTQTSNGRDHWDTPEIKLPGNKKGRLRKDRYTALVIANVVARCMSFNIPVVQHTFVGGYVGSQRKGGSGGRPYIGPADTAGKLNQYCGRIVSRN